MSSNQNNILFHPFRLLFLHQLHITHKKGNICIVFSFFSLLSILLLRFRSLFVSKWANNFTASHNKKQQNNSNS